MAFFSHDIIFLAGNVYACPHVFVFARKLQGKASPSSVSLSNLAIQIRSRSRGSRRAVVYNFNQCVNSVSAVTCNWQSLVPPKLIGFRPPVASYFSSLTTSHPLLKRQRFPPWEAAVSHFSDLWNDDRGAPQPYPSLFIALVCPLPVLLPPPPHVCLAELWLWSLWRWQMFLVAPSLKQTVPSPQSHLSAGLNLLTRSTGEAFQRSEVRERWKEQLQSIRLKQSQLTNSYFGKLCCLCVSPLLLE